jgi:hypothetical protein
MIYKVESKYLSVPTPSVADTCLQSYKTIEAKTRRSIMLFLVIFALVVFVVVKNIQYNALKLITDPKMIEKVNSALGYVGIDISKAIDLDDLLHSNDYAAMLNESYSTHYTDVGSYNQEDYAACNEGSNYTRKAVKFDVHSTVHGNYAGDTMATTDDDTMLDEVACSAYIDKSYSYRDAHSRKNYSRIHKYNKINRAACRSPYKQYDEEYLVEA